MEDDVLSLLKSVTHQTTKIKTNWQPTHSISLTSKPHLNSVPNLRSVTTSLVSSVDVTLWSFNGNFFSISYLLLKWQHDFLYNIIINTIHFIFLFQFSKRIIQYHRNLWEMEERKIPGIFMIPSQGIYSAWADLVKPTRKWQSVTTNFILLPLWQWLMFMVKMIKSFGFNCRGATWVLKVATLRYCPHHCKQ